MYWAGSYSLPAGMPGGNPLRRDAYYWHSRCGRLRTRQYALPLYCRKHMGGTNGSLPWKHLYTANSATTTAATASASATTARVAAASSAASPSFFAVALCRRSTDLRNDLYGGR